MSDNAQWYHGESTYDFVPPSLRGLPAEERPIFILKKLSWDEQSELDKIKSVFKGQSSSSIFNQTRKLCNACKQGVKGWRNFKPNGNEIPFSLKELENVDMKIIRELGKQLIGEAEVTPEEAESLE